MTTTEMLPPDFGTFIPDILTALLTGVVVGLILWRAQKRSARTQERLRARRESLRLVHPLQLALKHPVQGRTWESVATLPTKFTRLEDALKEGDIDYWHGVEETVLTTGLVTLRSRLRDLRVDAERLDDRVRAWHDSLQHPDTAVLYSLAKLQDAPGAVLTRLTVTPEQRLAAAEMHQEMLVRKTPIRQAAKKYRKAERRVDRAGEELFSILLPLLRSQGTGRSALLVQKAQRSPDGTRHPLAQAWTWLWARQPSPDLRARERAM